MTDAPEWTAPGQPPPPPTGPGDPSPAYQVPPSPAAPSPVYADPRPGIIPLRPLTLGDIYAGVAAAIRGNLAATVGLALLVSLVTLIPTTALGVWLVGSRALTGTSPSTDVQALVSSVASWLPSLVQVFAGFALSGFVAWVVGQGAIGRRVTGRQTWAATKGRIGALVGANLLLALVAVLGIAVVVGGPLAWFVTASRRATPGSALAPGLLLLGGGVVAVVALLLVGVRMAFVNPALVLEESGIVTAFRRSWALTRTAFWRILGITLLTNVLVAVVADLISAPVAAVLGYAVGSGTADLQALYVAQVVASGFTALVASTLTTPFTAGVNALLYLDLRFRREGLDTTLIRAAAGRGT